MLQVELFSTWVPLHIPDETRKGAYRPPPIGSPAHSLAREGANGGQTEQLLGRIGGIISSQAVDQQGEIIVQEGIDWSYFLSKGYLNYEHMGGPDNVLGYPDFVRPTIYKGEPATEFEADVYLTDPRAKRIYDTACTMKKAGGRRQLGFSVEGSVVARDPANKRRICKSKVLNVAITAHPVHPDAKLEVLARSLLVVDALQKSGAIGYQTPTQVSGGLSALVPQSLESHNSSATYGRRREGSKIHLDEMAALIRKTFPGYSDDHALDLARSLFDLAS